MPHYSGITTGLVARRAEHLLNNPNLRNWTVANNGRPFATREAAQAWEDRQQGEHHPGGGPATGS